MLWWIKTSYSYVCPRGFWEHFWFVVLAPGAFVRYRRAGHTNSPRHDAARLVRGSGDAIRARGEHSP